MYDKKGMEMSVYIYTSKSNIIAEYNREDV